DRRVGEQLGVVFPDQDGVGTHVNVSGAGVTVGAPNRANAIRLIEFLSSEEAQRIFAEANHEYPVKPGVPAPAVLQGWGEVPIWTGGSASSSGWCSRTRTGSART